MPLLFDAFGVRRVELDVLMWPGFEHGFEQGELSRLYGALNSTDLFESMELRANVGAQFESEHWRYDISTTRIMIRSESFQSFNDLDRQVGHLLSETAAFFEKHRSLSFLTARRAMVEGVVPEDKGKDVAKILPGKLLANRLRSGHEGGRLIDLLPGELGGTGLTLVGNAELEGGEEYHWHANVGPVHSPSMDLHMSAELYFYPPLETPEQAMISDRLKMAYEFVTDHIVKFAEQALK
jgi:hypothetical protein